MTAIASMLLCCCDAGTTTGCDGLPTTVFVEWTGSSSVVYQECGCDGDITCPLVGGWSVSGVSTLSTLVEVPPPEATCGYIGEETAEYAWALESTGDCAFCPPGSYSGTGFWDVTIGSPYRPGDGFWYVGITIAISGAVPPDGGFINPAETACNYGYVFGADAATVGRFKGPADTGSPVGTYTPDWSPTTSGFYFWEVNPNTGLVVTETVGVVIVS